MQWASTVYLWYSLNWSNERVWRTAGMICSSTRSSCNRRRISPSLPGVLMSPRNRSMASFPTGLSARLSIPFRMVRQVLCSMRRWCRLAICINSRTIPGSSWIRSSPLPLAQTSLSPSRRFLPAERLRNRYRKPKGVKRERAMPTKFAELYRSSLVISKNCVMNSSTGKTPSRPWNPIHFESSICLDRSSESSARPARKWSWFRSRRR